MTPTLEERAIVDLVDPIDEALAAEYAGSTADYTARAPNPLPVEKFSTALRDLLTPWSDEELEAAREPWPHVFQDRHCGIFPDGEVSILAAAGREGKTTVEVGAGTAVVIGHSLGGLWPKPNRSVIVYSAEDDRPQFARKIAAQVSLMGDEHAALVKNRLIVPNLDDPSYTAARSLVLVLENQPVASGTVEIIIEAIAPLMQSDTPPGLLIFETASTLSDAEENNPGFRVLILGLRKIARELGVAVVLSHHVSQASLANLPDLNVSTTDIRGGTALVNNARQTALLVNLGSDDDPFPDNDARTVLRKLATPGTVERVTVLITMDSSKGINPPPVFFRWVHTDFGPAAVEVDAPGHLRGRPWRKLHEMLRAERAEQRDQAKSEARAGAQQEAVRQVIASVKKLQLGGLQPTASRVSADVGRSPTWATPHLTAAVVSGLLVTSEEAVPRVRGPVLVYRANHPANDSTVVRGVEEGMP